MYINVGKAVLYQMLGVQSNHASLKNVLKVSGKCSECPWLLAVASHPSENMIAQLKVHCHECPFKGSCSEISDLSVEYINEKNRYGNKQKICRNAILLFILLHTYNPSKNGFIQNVHLSSIAEEMNVNMKTIHNCMEILVKNDYIFADKVSAGIYNFILLDYPSYFYKAAEGGRGFIKMNQDVIESLLNIDSILAFRLILRQLLESDVNKDAIKTYKELRLSLPAYCKRNVIKEKLQDYSSSIFDIVMNQDNVSFVLHQENDSSELYAKECREHDSYFKELLSMLDDFVLSYAPGIPVPDRLKSFLYDDNDNMVTPVLFQMNGTNDIAAVLSRLSCKYSREIVTDALADTYRLHMCQNKGLIRDIGAYILEVIRSYGLMDGKPSKVDFSKIDSSNSNLNLTVA